ncbi:DUF4007 family protein [Aureisphaera sp. CAU 1614]|uniref:DUF4007 family protein n=1 Tax=Halomarinibacterium sedimenti TaxID=2857106 RepID=A0A9X1JXM3_9FLAO|nr:DUF4007 family protein [Halomarinibacterium sedimenti]MBW2938238.1 DUF4007 family protein [Halomarinibacterium sedimenti]
MSVYFHANFYLDRGRLSGILKSLIESPDLTDEQVAKPFGYKAPFTKRYKSWLKKCGLLENTRKFKLTEKGKEIYSKDPDLNKTSTIDYMYEFLVSSEENAEVWHFFHYTFLPNHIEFTNIELSEAISMKLMPHNPSHFAKNAPMIKVITRVLLDTYLSERAFKTLNIIGLKNKKYINLK